MTSEDGKRTNRIQIDDSVIDIYKAISDGSDSEMVPFTTMKEVFMVAAFLGYRSGARRRLSGGAKTTIRQEVFERDMDLLKALAIADTKDVTVLQREGEILTIAEEYAHAGIHELQGNLLGQHGKPLWNLVSLLSNL